MRCVGDRICGLLHTYLVSIKQNGITLITIILIKRRESVEEKNNASAENIKKEKKKIQFTDLFQHTWFIILAFVLVTAVVTAVVIGIVMHTKNYTLGEVFGIPVKRIDYVNDRLDKFVEVEKSDYTGLQADVAIRKPDAMDVSDKKTQALAAAAKKAGLDFSGSVQYYEPIGAGDKIYFYYSAYLLDENGERVKEINGLNNCKNYGVNKYAEFVVGSGSFIFLQNVDSGMMSEIELADTELYIHGFESGLIGKVPNITGTYKPFYTNVGGEIREDDVVYATASYVDYDGLFYDRVNLRIDLSDENCESLWGEGIYDFISEKKIGVENKSPITLTRTGSGKKITFTNFTVDYISRGEENPVTVKTVFPYDYEDEELRNKTVYFDLYIAKTECYKTPEFDDEFITKTLGLTEARLAKYEGKTLVEKCENYYLEALTLEYEENRKILAEQALWAQIKENVEIVKSLEKEVQHDYDDYVSLMELACEIANENGAGYESFDEYMTDQLGLDVGAYWNVYVWDWLEEAVLEKIIFYSIIRAEGLMDNTEAYEQFCRNELERSYALEYGKTADDFESKEKYDKAIEDYRAEKVAASGGESGFADEMYYRYASSIIIDSATIRDLVK